MQWSESNAIAEFLFERPVLARPFFAGPRLLHPSSTDAQTTLTRRDATVLVTRKAQLNRFCAAAFPHPILLVWVVSTSVALAAAALFLVFVFAAPQLPSSAVVAVAAVSLVAVLALAAAVAVYYRSTRAHALALLPMKLNEFNDLDFASGLAFSLELDRKGVPHSVVVHRVAQAYDKLED
ncbi:hypothetical protein BC830DRAFT_1083172 [Chytriomyces sp. MP71]|nr:hypothetical protein BC830DRAFT_1083172 [Chytriomyces sp. MP71]